MWLVSKKSFGLIRKNDGLVPNAVREALVYKSLYPSLKKQLSIDTEHSKNNKKGDIGFVSFSVTTQGCSIMRLSKRVRRETRHFHVWLNI